MVASTVSSKMVEAMADKEGFRFAECLTGSDISRVLSNLKFMSLPSGFKFIGNTALNLTAKGFETPYGYEEAIGYMFGTEIRDKDGVAASVRLWNHQRGQTCLKQM